MKEIEEIKIHLYKLMKENKLKMQEEQLRNDCYGMEKFYRERYEDYKEELTLMSN